MRAILHINEKGGRFGGTEEYIAALAAAMARAGIESHLIYEHAHGELPGDLASAVRIDGLGDRNAERDVSDEVLRVVAETGPDVVFVHNIFDGRILRALDRPGRAYRILWYVHDHYPTCLTELRALNPDLGLVCRKPLSEGCLSSIAAGQCVKRHAARSFGPADLATRRDLLASLRHADAIVVVSAFMKEVLADNLPEIGPRTHVLPRQVRMPSHPRKPRARGRRVVLYSGRITAEKGLHIAIEALARARVDDKVVFRIAGAMEDEAYGSRCQGLAAEAMSRNPSLSVHYEGHLTYERLDALYGEADVVAVPSVWAEPLGVVVAEAMAHGAAVVASDVGGIGTWIEDGTTGLLADPRRVETFTEALERLLRDEDLRSRLARAGRRRVGRNHAEAVHLKRLLGLVRTLA
ncbi:MAG: glycosyltransferase family 4 protein [Kiloniellaceae bacterium]